MCASDVEMTRFFAKLSRVSVTKLTQELTHAELTRRECSEIHPTSRDDILNITNCLGVGALLTHPLIYNGHAEHEDRARFKSHADLLSTKITTLTHIISGLQRAETLYRAAASPIHSIPNELLTRILWFATWESGGGTSFEVNERLRLVCELWNQCVMRSPEMWSRIDVVSLLKERESGGEDRRDESLALERAITLASDYPLEVVLSLTDGNFDIRSCPPERVLHISQVLQGCSDRWTCLTVEEDAIDDLVQSGWLPTRLPRPMRSLVLQGKALFREDWKSGTPYNITPDNLPTFPTEWNMTNLTHLILSGSALALTPPKPENGVGPSSTPREAYEPYTDPAPPTHFPPFVWNITHLTVQWRCAMPVLFDLIHAAPQAYFSGLGYPNGRDVFFLRSSPFFYHSNLKSVKIIQVSMSDVFFFFNGVGLSHQALEIEIEGVPLRRYQRNVNSGRTGNWVEASFGADNLDRVGATLWRKVFSPPRFDGNIKMLRIKGFPADTAQCFSNIEVIEVVDIR
ncbi:hypothetical protein CC1G_11770 [Coprinopsis cinerea okayama7|uniref:F-box domain-containing protein n=1 Tax=Coprinopsis cinerea (strain Okayama-7 / 130 / ATCC MYA-4618 / FGSC 9003) TaxID=240176 RepID=A8NPH2_COPC7|nr:hypothetical protein CC1G_11770 [Coprinopsis cinerea okayama7\|eukprot:XP_001835336.1 hypothetical protein CC1G_11770 [Coprinopsis cinerea okayama7\